jgi:hypothetical protein
MLRENYKKEIATVLKYSLQGFKKDCTLSLCLWFFHNLIALRTKMYSLHYIAPNITLYVQFFFLKTFTPIRFQNGFAFDNTFES